MIRYQQDDITNRKLQRYRVFRVHHIVKFEYVPINDINALLANIRIKMRGIQSLDMSLLPSKKMASISDSLLRALAYIMPDLRELNFSHTNFNGDNIFANFSLFCPLLEKITWTNILMRRHIFG